jgi:hypothetical protein
MRLLAGMLSHSREQKSAAGFIGAGACTSRSFSLTVVALAPNNAPNADPAPDKPEGVTT